MNLGRPFPRLCLLSALLSVALLGACQPQPTPTTAPPAAGAAATAPPTQAPAASGATSAATAGVAADLDLPLCSGAKRMDQESADLAAFAARSNPPGAAAAYTCRDDPTQVLDAYRAQMPPLGWAKSLDFAGKEGGIITWDKGTLSAQAMTSVMDGKTVLLLGKGPKGASLLPSEGLATPGPTSTPRPTPTKRPTPTITPRPEGVEARKAYDLALAKAKEWSGDVVLLRAVADYSSIRKEGGVDSQGGGLPWVFHFAKAGAQGDAQVQWFQVTVGPEGVSGFKPYTSMIKSGDYKLIADVADWKVTSAQALQMAEEQGGKAYREALKEPAGIDATLTLTCMGACPDTPKGAKWEIRYEGGADQKVFEIDAATGKVVSVR